MKMKKIEQVVLSTITVVDKSTLMTEKTTNNNTTINKDNATSSTFENENYDYSDVADDTSTSNVRNTTYFVQPPEVKQRSWYTILVDMINIIDLGKKIRKKHQN